MKRIVFVPGAVLRVMMIRGLSLLAWAGILALVMPMKIDAQAFHGIAPWRYAAAGLEDAVFVLPALLIPKPWRWGFILISSLVFCVGHGYQGAFPAITKLPFVLVSYFLAQEYGIITTIVAHSLNDIFVLAALKGLRAA